MLFKVKLALKNQFKQRIYLSYIRNIKDFLVLTNLPYVSGDNFKKISNIIYNPNRKFNLNKLQKDSIVFVSGDFFIQFMEQYANSIEERLVLLVHNSKLEINSEIFSKVNNKNMILFIQNLNLNISNYDNIFILPTGFKNRNIIKNAKLNSFKNKNSLDTKKLNKFYTSLDISKDKERIELINLAFNNQMFNFHRYVEHSQYLDNLAKYKFSLCPRGEKLDTCKIWESLHVKTIPVLKKSNFSSNLVNIGIPILEVNNWRDLSNFDENDLNEIYKSFLSSFDSNEFTKFDFWKKYLEVNANIKLN